MVPVTEHADVVAFKLETPNRIAADDCVLLVRVMGWTPPANAASSCQS